MMQESCKFFVDDSNLWIEAKKIAARGGGGGSSGSGRMPKLTDSDNDPRLRIDLGELIRVVLQRRHLSHSFLYGSRPPPNDSVWAAAKKRNFNVEVFERSNGSPYGKEKQVDCALSSQLSEESTRLAVGAQYNDEVKKEKERTVFIVITGDRDMKSPIETVLKQGIRVELWAWKSGLSREFLRMKSQNSLLSVRYLDPHFDFITYTNYRSTRKGLKVDAGRAMVLCAFVDADAYTRDEWEDWICDHLVMLCHLFYVTWSKTDTELIVEFPRADNMDELDILIEKSRGLFKDQLSVISWPQYITRHHNGRSVAWNETSHVYGPLDKNVAPVTRLSMEGGGGGEASPVTTTGGTTTEFMPEETNSSVVEQTNDYYKNGSSNSSSAEDFATEADLDVDHEEIWTTVRTDPAPSHHRALQRGQNCRFGIHCRYASQCGSKHSDAEKRLFEMYPGNKFALWKTALCRRTVPHAQRDCRFAHDEGEAWCRRCHVEGHFIENCPDDY